jgi:hypothetical protein
MKVKISIVIILAAMSTLLTACSKEPPKCSDDSTAKLVRQIILGQIGGSEGLSEKEIQENMKIEYPRASAFDKNVKKYNCEAQLIAGGYYKLPITYESQLDDNNQHIVSVGGISRGDLWGVKSWIMTGIEKSRASKSETPTASSIAGTWKGSLEGDGEMVIKPASTGFDVALSVSSSSGCAGSIEGNGALSGNTLTLTKKGDDQVCTVTIKFVGDTANIDEDNCMSYHGAACSFYGTLKKIK